MKPKKVIIVYEQRGIENVFYYRRIYDQIIQEFHAEGREHKASGNNTAIFKDGSEVSLVQASTIDVGDKCTHLYFDESILDIEYGEMFVNVALKKMVLTQDDRTSFDVSEEATDRIMVFNEHEVIKYNK